MYLQSGAALQPLLGVGERAADLALGRGRRGDGHLVDGFQCPGHGHHPLEKVLCGEDQYLERTEL